MKRGLMLAVLAASLLLTACSSSNDDDYPYDDGGPAVTEGRVIDKGIDDGCNRLTLMRSDRVKNKKTKKYEIKSAIGYVCIPRPAWNDLNVGDKYEVPKP